MKSVSALGIEALNQRSVPSLKDGFDLIVRGRVEVIGQGVSQLRPEAKASHWQTGNPRHDFDNVVVDGFTEQIAVAGIGLKVLTVGKVDQPRSLQALQLITGELLRKRKPVRGRRRALPIFQLGQVPPVDSGALLKVDLAKAVGLSKSLQFGPKVSRQFSMLLSQS